MSLLSAERLSELRREKGVSQKSAATDLGVSQADHPEVFEGIKSESEGKRLVKYSLKRFNRLRRPWLVVPFGIQCVFKLLGYKLGKNYMKLPQSLVRKLTGNKAYWDINVKK